MSGRDGDPKDHSTVPQAQIAPSRRPPQLGQRETGGYRILPRTNGLGGYLVTSCHPLVEPLMRFVLPR